MDNIPPAPEFWLDDDPTDTLPTVEYVACTEDLFDVLYGDSLGPAAKVVVENKVEELRTMVANAKRDDLENRENGVITANISRLIQTDNRGWTPLHFAAQNGHTECIEILLEYFKWDYDRDACDEFGSLQEEGAAERSKELFDAMMKLGTFQGDNCLQLALRNPIRNESAIRFLLEYFPATHDDDPFDYLEKLVCGTFKSLSVFKWISRLFRPVASWKLQQFFDVGFARNLFLPASFYDEFGQKVAEEKMVIPSKSLASFVQYGLKQFVTYNSSVSCYLLVISMHGTNLSAKRKKAFVQWLIRYPWARKFLFGSHERGPDPGELTPYNIPCLIGMIMGENGELPTGKVTEVVTVLWDELHTCSAFPEKDRYLQAYEDPIRRLAAPETFFSNLEKGLFAELIQNKKIFYLSNPMDVLRFYQTKIKSKPFMSMLLKAGFLVPEMSSILMLEFCSTAHSWSNLFYKLAIKFALLGWYTLSPAEKPILELYIPDHPVPKFPSLKFVSRAVVRAAIHENVGYSGVTPSLLGSLSLPIEVQRYILFEEVESEEFWGEVQSIWVSLCSNYVGDESEEFRGKWKKLRKEVTEKAWYNNQWKPSYLKKWKAAFGQHVKMF